MEIGQFDNKGDIVLAVTHQYKKLNKIMNSLDQITRAQNAAYPQTMQECKNQRWQVKQKRNKLRKDQKQFAKTR